VTTLRDIVFRELDAAAAEQSRPFEQWPVALAHYLTLCSPALEGRNSSDLVPHVQEWLQQRRVG
jgi:hypothetical protein